MIETINSTSCIELKNKEGILFQKIIREKRSFSDFNDP